MAKSDNLYSRVLEKASKMLSPREAKYEALPSSECSEDLESPSSVPSDVQLCSAEEPEHAEVEHSCLEILVGWLCLVLAIFAGASVGPVFKFMMNHGIGPLQATSWRNQTMVLSLIPMTLWEAFSKKENKVDWFQFKPDLPYPVFVHIIISGIAWAVNLLFWVVGLQYVTTFKASIVASCHPVLLVIAMHFTGSSVSMAEWAGVLVSFGGMFISEYRPSSETSEKDPTDDVPFRLQLLGYFFCLLAAAGEVVTIMNRIKTRKYVPLMQYTLSTSVFVTIAATILSMALERVALFEDGQFCRNDSCVLGWATPTWGMEMLLFGLAIGAVCNTGFNYAMQYIPPLVFASITLVDPVVTAVISWVFGIEHLPGMFSWLGGGIVIAGVAVISYGEHQREQSAAKNVPKKTAGYDTLEHAVPVHHSSSRDTALGDDYDDDDSHSFSTGDEGGKEVELQVLQQ